MSYINDRIGQQNAVKVITSISGSAGGRAVIAQNVIGGISSVSELNVSGLSTFVGVTTFKNDVYIGGNLLISGDSRIGISTIGGIYIENPRPQSIYGVAFLDPTGSISITSGAASSSINYSNYILTTDYNNVPKWTSIIDGGDY